ncbi:MAG: DUF364 domain-containing protein [Pseudomonadota bacterium]
MDFFSIMRSELARMIDENGWHNTRVQVKVKTLTAEQAIGNPEHNDYPLVKGRERMMEADLEGAKGQAFTDRFGNFDGTMDMVADLPLEDSFHRATFIATLNAAMRRLGLCEGTVHCRDGEPPRCAMELVTYMESRYGNPKIAMVGLQPRMLEHLSRRFQIRVTDLDEDNIGTEKFGVHIGGPEETNANVQWCDTAFITGSTLSNGSLQGMSGDKPTVVFGVTVAGPARLLNLERFCPLGH